MPIRSVASKAGLAGFKAWLSEHFPGRRLEVSYTREGDDYICSLKFRGVLLDQGRGPSQKASATDAAARCHRQFAGSPATLRDFLRSREAIAVAPDAPTPATTSTAQSKELTGAKKLLAQQSKQLEQVRADVDMLEKSVKRLRREMAELQKLGLGDKLMQIQAELTELRSEMKSVAPGTVQALDLLQTAQLQQAQELVALKAQLTPTPAAEPVKRVVTYQKLDRALDEWAPLYAPMAGPLLATVLVSKVIVVPSIELVGGLYEALRPHVDWEVIGVDARWSVWGSPLAEAVLSPIKAAQNAPCSLHFLVLEGMQGTALHTWARPLCLWAQGLSLLPPLPGQRWPKNLRLLLVPRPQHSLDCKRVAGLAAVPLEPVHVRAWFDQMNWGDFLEQSWEPQRPEPQGAIVRLARLLQQFGQANEAERWQELIFKTWPETYSQGTQREPH